MRDNQEMIGNEQRGITVNNIKAQADQARSDAAFYRQASSLLSGDISAAAGVAKAVAGLGSLGGTPTDGMGLSLTTTGACTAAQYSRHRQDWRPSVSDAGPRGLCLRERLGRL